MATLLDELKTQARSQLFQATSAAGMVAVRENAAYRWLEVDGYVQSVLDLTQPERACLPHAQIINLAQLIRPKNLLLAGLGGGDLLRQFGCEQALCCELYPEVIELYQQYFAPYCALDGLQILPQDISAFIAQCQSPFDLIILDVFAGAQQPQSLQQESFIRACRAALSPQGCLVVNIKAEQQQALLTWLLMMRSVFAKKILMVPVPECDNIIVFAFNGRPFSQSNQEFSAALAVLNATLPSPVPLSLADLLAVNVTLSNNELELWQQL